MRSTTTTTSIKHSGMAARRILPHCRAQLCAATAPARCQQHAGRISPNRSDGIVERFGYSTVALARPGLRKEAGAVGSTSLALQRSFHSSPARCSKQGTYEQALSASPAPPTGTPVELDFDLHSPRSSSPSSSSEAGAIVIAHGLFGSKQNWRSLGKSIASRTGLPVYALDLRNHGDSPHVDSLHYADMAKDIIRFIGTRIPSDQASKGVILIGHSMGGKAVQSVALSPDLPADVLKGMISVDMSPKRGALSKEFAGYVDAMQEIERSKCSSRKEADEILQRWESDIGIRQFLLTNLTRSPPDSPYWSFRIPLDIIRRHISQLGDFPYSEGERKWEGRSLFVKGSKSAYINHKNIPLAASFFPHMRLVTLETGHWVQAERPKDFTDLVEKFVSAKGNDGPGEAPEK
ncbi:hypothetical protein OC845_000377 [Tilletia horrida]|nr:hypothetical protein OC845_000377 [Tilletia horrida]